MGRAAEILTMNGSEAQGTAPAGAQVTAVARIAVNTSDLGRFRAFYEGLVRLPHVISLRMQDPPFLVYAVFAIGDTALQAIEIPGFDPAGDVAGADLGVGARIDHFALLVEGEAALRELRDRLVAAGASDGAVTTMGPYLSVGFRDPDGLYGVITCPHSAFDPTQSGDEVVECSLGPEWANDLLTRPRSAAAPDA